MSEKLEYPTERRKIDTPNTQIHDRSLFLALYRHFNKISGGLNDRHLKHVYFECVIPTLSLESSSVFGRIHFNLKENVRIKMS